MLILTGILISETFHIASSLDFYSKLEEEINKLKVGEIELDIVKHSEATIFSSKRKYYRVTWKEYKFDICAVPFGTSYFFSWWCVMNRSGLYNVISIIPIIGQPLADRLFPITYFKIDTASVLMSAIHGCVLKVIDDISKEKGIRPLPELERKPILRDIFKR